MDLNLIVERSGRIGNTVIRMDAITELEIMKRVLMDLLWIPATLILIDGQTAQRFMHNLSLTL